MPKPGIHPKACAICRRAEQYMIHHGLTMREAALFQQGVHLAEIRRKRALPELEQRCDRMGI